MSWLDLLPALCIALGTLTLPGLFMAGGWRIRPLMACAFAPALSMTSIVLSGLIASSMDRSWSVLWVFAVAIAIALIGMIVHAFPAVKKRHTPIPVADDLRSLGLYLAGMAIMAVLFLPRVLDTFRAADAVNQRFDNAFHVLAIRHIADSFTASPFSLGDIGGGAFYPIGWHSWNALVVMSTDVSVSSAIQACSLIAIFLIWPLSLIALVETMIPMNAVGRLILGPLALASSSFPLALVDFGSLYPNMIGCAIMPALIAAAWNFFSITRSDLLSPASSCLFAFLILPGVTLAHPNATLSAGAVVMLPMLGVCITRLVQAGHLKESEPRQWRYQLSWTALGITIFIAFIAVWIKATLIVQPSWSSRQSIEQAIGEILMGTTMGKTAMWTLSIGLIAGLFTLIRTTRGRWVFLSFFTAASIYIAANGFPDSLIRALLTRLYYADPYRPAAVLGVMSIPIAIYGWMRIVDYLDKRLPIVHKRLTNRWSAAIISLVLALTIIWCPGMNQQLANVATAFTFDETSNLLTPDEEAIIDRLDTHLPPNAPIIIDPYQGGGFVYVRTNRPLQTYYMHQDVDEDTAFINENLNRLNEDERICPILNEKNLHYVLVLDRWHVNGFGTDRFLGLYGFDYTPGFELLDQQGTSRLYKITGCQGR